jgi:cation transport ATPase
MHEVEQHGGTGATVGPVARPVACASCGSPVDPLRAARVAIFNDRFRYFCSSECRDRYDPVATRTPLPRPRPRRPGETLGRAQAVTVREDPRHDTLSTRRQTAEALADVTEDPVDALSEPLDVAAAHEAVLAEREDPDAEPLGAPPVIADDVVAPTDIGSLLLALAMLGGTLAVALVLAGNSGVAQSSRVVVVLVACAALVAQYVMGERDPIEPHPAALLAAPVTAAAAALGARVLGHAHTSQALTLAGVVIACVAATVWVMQRARRAFDVEREHIAAELDQPGHRVVGDEVVEARAADLRPGEEIVVEAGETVPVDATVAAGNASVSPWLGAKAVEQRGEGDPIVAGARVLEGRLRVVVGWAGYDRAWMRLTNDPRRRADLLAPLARVGRLAAERGAPMAAGLAALTAFAANQTALGIVMFAVAAQAALANAGVAGIGALHVARSVLLSLRRGVAFRSADALDRAGRISATAFCARGTLLLGEPEVANIEPFGPHDAERVLALVAGAESGANHAVASAVLRAARARGVRPDGVRSPDVQHGLGVTAVASNGQPLVVGSRALMLKERISVATAESRITDLEAMGRTVLLVALGGRLIGVVGLQDGLRPGARAAVQHLLDVGVEPVLLSGDARETCEALGRALDIEHVRPELLPTERGEEIRRLADGGATVAVVGRSPGDDAALSAADVAIALGAAGSSAGEWSVQLASDDARDAAYAVRLAHRCRSEGRMGMTLTLGPGIGGALAVAFGVAPPSIAPIAALLGTLAAVGRLRARAE